MYNSEMHNRFTGKSFAHGNVYITIIQIIIVAIYRIFISYSFNLFRAFYKSSVTETGFSKKSLSPKTVPDRINNNVSTTGRNVPGVLLNSNNFLPPWFDLQLAKIGQEFSCRHKASIYYATFLNYIFFVGDVDIRRILLSTGDASTPERSLGRFAKNFLHIDIWFLEDFVTADSKVLQSFNVILAKHKAVFLRAKRSKNELANKFIQDPIPGENPLQIETRIWNAFQKDLEASHLVKFKNQDFDAEHGSDFKFNQTSLAVALFLHFGFVVMCPEKVLILNATDEELMGFLHLWAIIGRAVGLSDEYNIAIQHDLNSAKTNLQNFLETTLVPLLFYIDYETKVVYEALFKSIKNAFAPAGTETNATHPTLTEFALLRLLEDILEVPCPNMRSVLTEPERSRAGSIQMFQRHPRLYKFIEPFMNELISGVVNTASTAKLGINSHGSQILSRRNFRQLGT